MKKQLFVVALCIAYPMQGMLKQLKILQTKRIVGSMLQGKRADYHPSFMFCDWINTRNKAVGLSDSSENKTKKIEALEKKIQNLEYSIILKDRIWDILGKTFEYNQEAIMTALEIIIASDHYDKAFYLKTLESLLPFVQNISAPNKNSDTLLHIAVRHGRSEVIAMLLQRTDLNINALSSEDCDGWSFFPTALHAATVYGYVEIVKMLLRDKRIDPSIKGLDAARDVGVTARDLAEQWHPEIVKIFDEFGIKE